MIQTLIKFVPGMDQVIHGVNRYRKLALYNLPLSIQILAINFFISLIGFIFLIFFNYFFIKNDDTIEKKRIWDDLLEIHNYLLKNKVKF